MINQDVERTFPDCEYFRQARIQQCLNDILFIYCRENEDISYRQGMHELLAPLVYVIDNNNNNNAQQDERTEWTEWTRLFEAIDDPQYLLCDSYLMFERLMGAVRPWFYYYSQPSNRNTAPFQSSDLDIPIVQKCQRLQNELLQTADKRLYTHLNTLKIEPQVYGMQVSQYYYIITYYIIVAGLDCCLEGNLNWRDCLLFGTLCLQTI